jgi:hypothetical protein
MYADYCDGMSAHEVATKWHVDRGNVSLRFKAMRLPFRARTGGTVQPRPGSNAMKAAEAGQHRAAAAMRALPMVSNEKHRQVLELRIAHPTATLAELAAQCDPPITKHSFASHLRRALERTGE